VRVEAADEENPRRLQELVGGHVEKFPGAPTSYRSGASV
jgi:hypothetical protein